VDLRGVLGEGDDVKGERGDGKGEGEKIVNEILLEK
jgi:hypothetical protein